MADPPPPKRPAVRDAALFALGVAGLVLVTAVLLSFDWPMARPRNPQTDNAYVDGNTVPVAAHVQGYLVALPVRDNQAVRAGDAVAQIEDDDYLAQLSQAQAQLAQAQAQLAITQAQLGELSAQIGQAQTQQASQQAESVRTAPELVRQERLINTDVGELRNLQQAQADQRRQAAQIEASHAAVVARQRQLGVLDAQVAQQAAAVRERQAELELARINLRWTTIRAPADGTLSARQVRVGDLLTPGRVLMELVPLETVWVNANYTERQIPGIAVGQRARIRLDAFPGAVLEGHVLGLAPLTGDQMSAVPPDNATGNYTKVVQRVTVRVGIDWHGSPLIGRVRPGMSATVTVLTDPA